ncbi:hypothetical protein ABOM_000168 [Aspergillus bombycis]|uniref:Protein kinase domain-containing protein n=1 Tax=Aspergillus bombycis TaxID=109264 RepID=A0A1F8AHV9_9EURO|nr:hypothetical protein ABOM_000168 [Aspergillus bombycis]OGM51323.1 hypothetical protein ABOM_000168 [Aspergillus bombycis]
METASASISRVLPYLHKINGTTHQSDCREAISLRFFHQWTTFNQDVADACASLDLTGLVPIVDESTEEFIVGSELGLTGRFAKQVCDVSSKALSTTVLAAYKFGDYNAIEATDHNNVPDIVMLTIPSADARAVGEMKTYWTVRLDRCSINDGYMSLLPLQSHLAQLVRYMRGNFLRYGFLSTYNATIFVRRTDPYRFEVTMPIKSQGTSPTIRQCFVALAVFASQDWKYNEPDGFSLAQLRIPTQPHTQASLRPSPLRNQVAAPGDIREPIGNQSILFADGDGNDTRTAITVVNCTSVVRTMGDKAIFEVLWDGRPAIAKCWGEDLYERFVTNVHLTAVLGVNQAFSSYRDEYLTYQKIQTLRPGGYEFFPLMYSHGAIACSSIFPKGYIAIMSRFDGVRLDMVWDHLRGSTKEHVRLVIHKAIKVLREIEVIQIDCGAHNVLYNSNTESAVLCDFELMQACESDTRTPDLPEMYAIFGDMPPVARVRHDGG